MCGICGIVDYSANSRVENEWIKGKTGFKTIQYMSVGIPCVVSSLGSNREIVKNGVNGFLATSDEEWIEKISLLIEKPVLRKIMGTCARKTVEEKFSLEVSAPKYLEIFIKCLKKRSQR